MKTRLVIYQRMYDFHSSVNDYEINSYHSICPQDNLLIVSANCSTLLSLSLSLSLPLSLSFLPNKHISVGNLIRIFLSVLIPQN